MKRKALLALLLLCLHRGDSKILRNNALMSKMVSDFHKEPQPQSQSKPKVQRESEPRVLSLMQTVLCKNFPSVPCEMIVRDATLKTLIERSIQQLKYKKLNMEKSTVTPGYQLTLFPTANSQELSIYRSGQNAENLPEKENHRIHNNVLPNTTPKSAEVLVKRHKSNPKSTAKFFTRKTFRKFYPHKVKYKDKNDGKEFTDYSGEKLSMSVEVPDMTVVKKHQHYSYKREPENPPVWRIDYMKHGEPSLNHFGYEAEQLKGKLIKSGPSLIVDDHELEQAVRKDVMHPDVYIKKNVRSTAFEINSEGSD